MSNFYLILRELIGLFVDDEFLAVGVLAVVGLAATCAFLIGTPSIVVGTVLVVSSVGVLVLSVLKTSRTS
jgi:hypothetical protein